MAGFYYELGESGNWGLRERRRREAEEQKIKTEDGYQINATPENTR
jgi:intein/homing endonuclease